MNFLFTLTGFIRMEVVIAEVLPSIKSCTIYGKCYQSFEGLKSIETEKSNCNFIFKDESRLEIIFPSGTSLVSNSVSGFNYDGSSVVLRAQIDDKTILVDGLLTELINDVEDLKPYKNDFIHFKPDTEVCVTCRYCSTEITDFVKFRRTCQLPSVNWEHASEDWFCCLEKPVKENLKPHSLQPNEDECFYAQLFYLLNKNNLAKEFVLKDNTVVCNECNFHIGDICQGNAKFWRHSIKWMDKSKNILYFQTETESLISLFDNIDRDNFGVNCRLVLEKQSSPKEFIFMVTMNTNLKFLMSSNVFFGKKITSDFGRNGIEKDPIKEGNSIPIKKLCINSEDTSYNKTSISIELNKYKVIKLLFKHKIGEDEETGSWVDDINVHILPCGDRFFDTTLINLNNSNNLLPKQSNRIDDMLIGYVIR